MKLKPSVAVTGYYGQKNFGDDIFCNIAAWGIKKYWNKSVFFLSEELPVLPEKSQYSLIPKSKIKGFFLLANVFYSIMSDSVIYAGGSIFHSGPKSILYPNYWHNHLAQLSNKYGAIGISTGPFKTNTDYKWVKQFLDKFAFISARDFQSYKTLESMQLRGKVVQAFDLAVLFPLIIQDEERIKHSKSNKVIGISVCHYERFTKGDVHRETKRENALLKTMQLILKENDHVHIILFSLNNNPIYGDKMLAIDLKKRLINYEDRIEIACYENDPLAIWQKIKECDIMIGVRLHSCIMAYAARIPFIMVEYHQKCTDFLDSINYPIKYRINEQSIDPENLSDNIHEILNMKSEEFYESIFPLASAQGLAIKSFIEAPWNKQ